MKNNMILVQDIPINVTNDGINDYICLTDIANGKMGNSRKAEIIKNWLRNRNTLEFLGTWEMIYNPNFKVVEFDHFRNQAGLHTFTLSVSEWIEKTNARGLIVKKGKYGGTYAHKDIAFEFASAISPVFKLYLIKEFQRLKEEENKNIDWNVKRLLSKSNYIIHTDAVKENIVPLLTEEQKKYVYASEADVLNVALFGMTAKEWKNANPNLEGNMRDYADILHLVVLINLENLNAEMITDGIDQKTRIEKLNNTARRQIEILSGSSGIKRLEKMEKEETKKISP